MTNAADNEHRKRVNIWMNYIFQAITNARESPETQGLAAGAVLHALEGLGKFEPKNTLTDFTIWLDENKPNSKCRAITDEELVALQKNAYLPEAKRELAWARKLNWNGIRMVDYYLALSGTKPEAIGTTNAELDALWKGCPHAPLSGR
jgi:hypothetical protein